VVVVPASAFALTLEQVAQAEHAAHAAQRL